MCSSDRFGANIFTFAFFPAVFILAGTLVYAASVHRLAQRGRSWPPKRSAAYAAGIFAMFLATQTWLGAQDDRLFSVHVVQHLLLSMVAPILLCLGSPFTLILQAADRKTQTRLLKVLHNPLIKVLTAPPVAWLIFVCSLFVLYYTDLYPLSLRNVWFHELVHIHFVVSGFLFFAPVIAIDPHPWRMHHGARLLYVGLTLPAHAFLALALISANTPLALDWYTRVTGKNVEDILFDQKLGAGIMWASGDFIAIAAVAVVALQWSKLEDRAAVREDRYVDLVESRQATEI